MEVSLTCGLKSSITITTVPCITQREDLCGLNWIICQNSYHLRCLLEWWFSFFASVQYGSWFWDRKQNRDWIPGQGSLWTLYWEMWWPTLRYFRSSYWQIPIEYMGIHRMGQLQFCPSFCIPYSVSFLSNCYLAQRKILSILILIFFE